MKVLVTGANGQLGYDVVQKFSSIGIECIGVSRHDFDITDEQQTLEYITSIKPDVIVHCAAYTSVDEAEEDRKTCYAVNVEGTRNLAIASKKNDAKMVYISSDYVFNGEGTEPHSEDKPTYAVNYYGYTKEKGEEVVKERLDKYFIVRTSWLYGRNGKNFVKTMMKLAANKDEISVVNDQIGAPTYTKDLAALICDLIQTKHYGIYHGVNEGYCSWYEFALEIMKREEISVKVNPIPSVNYPTRAKRPYNSKLSKQNLINNGFSLLPDWKLALERYLNSERENK
ncbi:dTDP-4-dehydrorhamnose reductase [Chengkuizengella sp. 2205SS18-9]|uniref:dTDP-4-dehydrorhamnose reductase n=1 Tax=Chengkuizengella axinellae TaxID=3064388 RepID=A0ABT9IZC1_9BACL|nr:dTDP-4-dehydrorhamnose reductase [Chengkuizengella sp. 2205SS18-9]MDP5274719.1 dTDP-4-dehydrorhamnose reductase [Chengkuizengella sp. 2205SS18-9]